MSLPIPVRGAPRQAPGRPARVATTIISSRTRRPIRSIRLPGTFAKVADISIEVSSRTWTTLVNVADGGFVSHAGANQLTTAQAAALTYSVTKTGDAADGARAYVVIRIPDTEDHRDFRIRQSFSGANYYINNFHTIGSTGGFAYAYSRHTLFAGYLIHIQEAATETTTHFRGESDAENVEVDASGFSGNLGTGDDDVQTALATIDGLTLGGGGATFTIHSLPAETTIAAGDSIPFSDASDSNDPKRITRQNFGTAFAGRGIEATATGQLQLDLDGPPLISTVEDADLIPLSDASDSFATKRTTIATLGTHIGTGGGGGGGTTVTANPGTDDANLDATSLTIAATDYNVADEAARADVDALEDLLGYSGRQELHARPPLPVEELTGSRNRLVRSLGYVDGILYGFTSEAAGGTVNGTDLLNNRDPQDGGAVGLTPETVPQTLYFFLNGTTLYAQNFNGGGSETTFNTATIRSGVPYALSTYPDEPGKLYMLIDGGDVYVEELDFNALGTITHAETVATITPAILNTYGAFGGYEDETDVVSDNGGSGGDASGITDIYVSGDYAWFLVTYAEDATAGTDFNYIARFARTDSAITAPATVTDADMVETGIRSDANQNSLVALATDGGLLTDLFLSRASNPIIDHFTNSRLGDYEDLANRPDELSTANVEDAGSDIFGLVSGERLEEHTLDAVPDVPIYFDGNMHGDPFDPDNPLGPNVVEFESDSHLNIQYHTDASTTNTATQEIKGNIYTSGDRTFHITSVDMWSGYILNRTYHAHIAVVDTANGDQVTAVYPSATRYHAPSSGRSGVFEHQYTWGSVGIEIPPNTDFAIMLGPVDNQGSTVIRSGAQASDSPTESNPDNSDDIAYLSPATHTGFALHVNNSLTRPSNGFVLGNFKIYYHTTLGGILSQAEIEVRNAGVVVDVDNANEAVDGINVEGGLEAVRDAANPNIPIVRIEDLGVSTDKLAGDAVTGPKMADDTVADDHLVADLAERICPDPSTGTSGQVCSRNTAGTAYELTTPTGGGGGTDDQTAAEVSVDTSGFSRNLTAADDTVQAALETIDGFTQYQGTWQQAAWPAGVIVRRSGIPYLSLVNNNTEIPTPSSTQWSGLSEGFIYRGAAPVLATNYNYGQVVLEPDTDVYYYFTSTISASVARADIATHANFHVIGGETGHSPRVGSGNAFPTTPAPLASDIFFFNADVASGLDWLDTDGTTDLTAATAGDMARFDGTDWIKVVNLVGGGGARLPDFFDVPIEDVATINVSDVTPENYLAIDANNVITNRGGFTIEVGTNTHQAIKVPVDGNYTITAVTSIQQLNAGIPRNRTRFQFSIVRAGADVSAAGSGLYASYGRATIPAGFAGGSYTVDLLADDQIEMRYSEELATTATYTLGGGLSRISVLLNSGGGGSTAGQQAAGGRTLVQRNIITARQAQAEFGLDTEWTNVDGTSPTFTAIPRADFDRIEIGFWVNSSFVYPIVLTRAMVTAMGATNNPLPTGLVDADDIPGAFLSFRTIAGADSREPVLLNPRYGFMEARRMANRCGIFIHMNDNSDNDWAQVGFHYVCEDQIDLEYVRAYFYEDAN